jgi:hypothetical protein
MPPTQASLSNTMYQTGPTPNNNSVQPPALGAPAPTAPIIYRNEHIIYQMANVRGDYQDQVSPLGAILRNVKWNRNALGDSVYLPFYADHISSIQLPVPPPAGLTFFWTDNLSGCRFFVDTIGGSNDLIVYHANTTQNSAGPNAWADAQTNAAGNVLTTMRNNARGDGPYAGLVLTEAASLAMPTYFRLAGTEERRKGKGPQGRNAPASAHAARTRPQFSGGCYVCGFFNAGQWEFWYQTWGEVGYTRPGYIRGILTFDWVGVHKRRTEGAEKTAAYATMNVLEYSRFQP